MSRKKRFTKCVGRQKTAISTSRMIQRSMLPGSCLVGLGICWQMVWEDQESPIKGRVALRE